MAVLLELVRTPLTLDAQKASIKNWERIRNKNASYLLTLSYKNAQQDSLEWSTKLNRAWNKMGGRVKMVHIGKTYIPQKRFFSHLFCPV